MKTNRFTATLATLALGIGALAATAGPASAGVRYTDVSMTARMDYGRCLSNGWWTRVTPKTCATRFHEATGYWPAELKR